MLATGLFAQVLAYTSTPVLATIGGVIAAYRVQRSRMREELLVEAHDVPATALITAAFFAGFLLLLIIDMVA